ncbi:unnamed protein product [Timema podura]|uniref:Uncharacterized protein n=1 Tax=Timema podura TaxID=61482 RepID=A0ABN7PHM3_TIMPD|nr:unnamed protein product [Timema podura]
MPCSTVNWTSPMTLRYLTNCAGRKRARWCFLGTKTRSRGPPPTTKAASTCCLTTPLMVVAPST